MKWKRQKKNLIHNKFKIHNLTDGGHGFVSRKVMTKKKLITANKINLRFMFCIQ